MSPEALNFGPNERLIGIAAQIAALEKLLELMPACMDVGAVQQLVNGYVAGLKHSFDDGMKAVAAGRKP